MNRDKRYYTIKVTKPGNDYAVELLEGSRRIGSTDELEFDKNADGMKKTAHYQLNFRIDDSSLASADKVKFAPADTDVLWVWTDTSACPTAGNYMPDTFWIDKNKNGKDLRIINMYLRREKLRFQINMVKANDPTARPFIELDPIVNNGNNGGAEPFMSQYLMTGLVVGGIVGLGATMLPVEAVAAPAALVYGIGGAVLGALVGVLLDRI